MSTFGAKTTAHEVAAACAARIAGKTVLVTGVSPGGLGASTVETLAAYSPKLLILAGRNASKTQQTADAIAAAHPGTATRTLELDLASQKQVRQAAAEVLAYSEPIDVLINNAAIMACPYATTADGLEAQFGTNHIGHFLFTNLIMPRILAAGPGARIVSVSSNGYEFSHIRFDDLNFNGGESYDPWRAYGQTKTANMLFAVELAKRLGPRGLVAASLHPGVIHTKLASNSEVGPEAFGAIAEINRANGRANQPFEYKTLEEGTATHIFAAFHPELESHNGAYCDDSNVIPPEQVRCWGRDPVEAGRLWKASEEIVGQKFDF